jgi:hypothetical protein
MIYPLTDHLLHWLKECIYTTAQLRKSHLVGSIALTGIGRCQPVCPAIRSGGRPTVAMRLSDALPSCTPRLSCQPCSSIWARTDGLSRDPRQCSFTKPTLLVPRGKATVARRLSWPLVVVGNNIQHQLFFFAWRSPACLFHRKEEATHKKIVLQKKKQVKDLGDFLIKIKKI